MKQKLRWRYYCDFCKKTSGRKNVIAKHETSCTSNPVRVCRMCQIAGLAQKDRAELFEASKKGTSALRDLASGCPACMLVGIKQLRAWQDDTFKLLETAEEAQRLAFEDDTCDWDFKKECAAFWQEHGRDRYDHDHEGWC